MPALSWESQTFWSTLVMRNCPGQLAGQGKEPPPGSIKEAPTPQGMPFPSLLPYEAASSGGKFIGLSIDADPSVGSDQCVRFARSSILAGAAGPLLAARPARVKWGASGPLFAAAGACVRGRGRGVSL